MSADLSDILSVCEQLVNNSTERKRYKTNPKQYLKDKGISHPLGMAAIQVSTVITLNAKSTNKRSKREKKLEYSEIVISTENDVLLVEIPKDANGEQTYKYDILDGSWLDYDEANNKLEFCLRIRFTNAIVENKAYQPILVISCPVEQQPKQGRLDFESQVEISFDKYILVKKYCPFHPDIIGARYDSTTDTLHIDFNQLHDPTSTQSTRTSSSLDNPGGTQA